MPFTTAIWQICLLQAAAGAGNGGLMTLLMALSLKGVNSRGKTTAMGFFQGVYSVGMMLGPALMGALIENGGGAGSNTVISPSLHKEFCTPYDRQLHDALHSVGIKVVYHLCGGLMKQLDNVVANGADGLETMTPPGMGGDCDLAEATRLVGDKLFFVGGFNQKDGFERGTPKRARELVLECHAACPDGGFIISPSDHFFHGAPECIQSFADAAKECLY
jgi:uroporphyrinogen-III decarboxylase